MEGISDRRPVTTNYPPDTLQLGLAQLSTPPIDGICDDSSRHSFCFLFLYTGHSLSPGPFTLAQIVSLSLSLFLSFRILFSGWNGWFWGRKLQYRYRQQRTACNDFR